MTASTSILKPDLRHTNFKNELAALLEKHAGQLPETHMLAIAAQVVGMMIAMQDQRTMTADMAMEMVQANIVEGNQQVLAQLDQPGGKA